jgi:hypothetical protein
MPLGSQYPFQPDLKPANQQGILADFTTHNQPKMKENPCFLGQELSARGREYICVKMTYLNMLC